MMSAEKQYSALERFFFLRYPFLRDHNPETDVIFTNPIEVIVGRALTNLVAIHHEEQRLVHFNNGIYSLAVELFKRVVWAGESIPSYVLDVGPELEIDAWLTKLGKSIYFFTTETPLPLRTQLVVEIAKVANSVQNFPVHTHQRCPVSKLAAYIRKSYSNNQTTSELSAATDLYKAELEVISQLLLICLSYLGYIGYSYPKTDKVVIAEALDADGVVSPAVLAS